MLSPKRGDIARLARSHAEQLRHLRVQRPKRNHIKTLSFEMEGQITLARFRGPALVTQDPFDVGEAPEFKQIIAVDGFLETGEILISWQHNGGYFCENHAVSGPRNRVLFDGLSGRPEPFIIETEAVDLGEHIRWELTEEPAFPAYNFVGYVIFQTVPV